MSSHSRCDLTDSVQIPPDARLCRQLLRDSLAQGVSTVQLVNAGSLPVVNRYLNGQWQPYMQFPPQPFVALIRQLKSMAAFGPDQARGSGTIHVQAAGRDAEITLTNERIGEAVEILTLRLPAPPAGARRRSSHPSTFESP